MGQDPGTSGSAMTDTQDPAQMREDIETTRQELGDTVQALAEKTDVKAQAKCKLDETKTAVTEKKEELLGKVKEASPDQVVAAGSQLPQKARENRVPLVVAGAFGAGFLIGRRGGR